MTIENPEAFTASLPDWAILDGCFGNTRIKPSDVDGIVERDGHVLYLEHKSGPRVRVKRGQELLYESLARKGDAVIVFWSSDGCWNVVRMRVWWGVDVIDKDPADLPLLRAWVAGWFGHADPNTTPEAAMQFAAERFASKKVAA